MPAPSPASRGLALGAALLVLALAAPARAEVELSFYGGFQSAPHSEVSIEGDAAIPDLDFTAGWEGRSFEAPPHYGLRATWWRGGGDWGLGLDLNHAKVYADDETLAETGLDRLEFTDGLNIVTLNAMRRFPGVLERRLGGPLGRATPYVGFGLGVAVPHVEVEQGEASTLEYQLTGPAAALMAGASVPITERISAFAEYKATFSSNEAELEGGGTLETDIVTNALNLGVSYRF